MEESSLNINNVVKLSVKAQILSNIREFTLAGSLMTGTDVGKRFDELILYQTSKDTQK